jgi:hypothetical protein
MKNLIALFILVLSLTATAKAARPVYYTCDRSNSADLVTLHFCSQLLFALSDDTAKYKLNGNGFWIRIQSLQVQDAPDGESVISATITRNFPGKETEYLLNSRIFVVRLRPGDDNTRDEVEQTLALLELSIDDWNRIVSPKIPGHPE